jgi:hypothetical protein
MKSIETIIGSYKSNTLDGRDLGRLVQFLTEEQAAKIGIEFKDEYKGKHEPIPFTRENVLKQLERDVAFGFEKSLSQRGISAGLMFEVVLMWNWILEEGLEDYDGSDGYAQYGLPLFKATAVKYGFDNPIGEKVGDESEFACDY